MIARRRPRASLWERVRVPLALVLAFGFYAVMIALAEWLA